MNFFTESKPALRKRYGFAADIAKLIPDDGCVIIFNAGYSLAVNLRKRCRVARSSYRDQSEWIQDGYSDTQTVCDLYLVRR